MYFTVDYKFIASFPLSNHLEPESQRKEKVGNKICS